MAYGHAKTANVLFAVEFDRRRRIEASARRPSIRAGSRPSSAVTWAGDHEGADRHLSGGNAAGKPTFEFKSIPQGAATSVWAGVVAAPTTSAATIARIAMSPRR